MKPQTATQKVPQMRLKAKRTNKTYHVYPLDEAAVHCLELTEARYKANMQLSPEFGTGGLCFCEPDCEDYTLEGGGVLILHRQVRWQ